MACYFLGMLKPEFILQGLTANTHPSAVNPCGSGHDARPRYRCLKGSVMPLIHISLRAGKPETYRQAIFDSFTARCVKRSTCPKTTSS
jgi:hypothetical protein